MGWIHHHQAFHFIITGCYFSGSKPLAKLAKLNPKPIKRLLQYTPRCYHFLPCIHSQEEEMSRHSYIYMYIVAYFFG